MMGDDGPSDFFIGGDDVLRNQQFNRPDRGRQQQWRGGPPMRGSHRPHFDMGPRFREPGPMGPPRGGPMFRGGPRPGFMGRPMGDRMMMMRGGPPFQGRPMRGGFRAPQPVDWKMDNDEEEIWAETDGGDGKFYYYHTKTRDTTWERPEGPNIRIVKHEEWLHMSGIKPRSTENSLNEDRREEPVFRQPVESGRNEGVSEEQPLSGSPQQQFVQQKHQPNPFTQQQQQNPFTSHQQQQNPAESVQSGVSLQQNQPMIIQQQQEQQSTMQQPTTTIEQQPATSLPHTAVTPQTTQPQAGGYGQFVGMPPFGMATAGSTAHPGFPQNFTMMPPPAFAMGLSGVPPPILQQIDPKVVAAASEWSEHVAPDGRPYYYHSKTQKSVWEKPQALIDLDHAKSAYFLAAAQQQAAAAASMQQQNASKKDESKAKEAKKSDVKKAADKCRPISSSPVAGTTWCVVWTGDRRVFFYNPLNKQSIWERPTELIGRLDVDELIRNCPVDANKNSKVKRAEATSTTSPGDDSSSKAEDGKTGSKKEDSDDKPPASKKKKKESKEGGDEKKSVSAEECVNGVVEEKSDSGDTVKVEAKDGTLKEVSAAEAENRAAQERATIPYEDRAKKFRGMMIEKEVSAFSTWEKELHKIVYDPRYLLLTSKERKVAFDEFVTERAEVERQEIKQKQKENKSKFFKFLKEIKITTKMSYNEFTQKFGREERYKMIEKPRDREAYFAEFIHELKQKEKKEAAKKKEKYRDEFSEMLREKVTDCHLKWTEVKKKFDSDSRYNAIESAEERESLYKSFAKNLKCEIKAREKKKKKERKEEEKKRRAEDKLKEKEEGEKKNGNGSEDNEKKAKDESNKMEEDISEEEEGCITDDDDSSSSSSESVDSERKQRAEVSIREREREVQKSMASHLRDRDKERDFYRHEEARTEFQALLTDLVRNTELSWKEVRKILKQDDRWDSTESILGRDEMEDLFNQHCESIGRKKKQRFRELLDEAGVTLHSHWKDIRRKIKDDPRYTKFSSNDRKCEREFELYLKDKHATMKNEFRELLKETKMLTYRTREQLIENCALMKDIEALLSKDKRFLQMDGMKDTRERLLYEYLDDLERKGPPPPPTSSRAMELDSNTASSARRIK